MSYHKRNSLEETLAQLEREFEEVDCDYTGPRIDEEGCTDDEDDVELFPIAVSSTEGSRNDSNTHEDVMITDSPGFTVEPSGNSVNSGIAPNTTVQETRNIDMQRVEDFSRDNSVVIERSIEDKREESLIDEFLAKTCGCQLGSLKSPCSTVVSHKTIVQTRNNCHQMSAKELDLVIMSQLNALRTHVDDKPSSSGAHIEFRPTTKYFIHGIPICQKMFCFLHTVGKFRLESLSTWVTRNGVTERMHGNTKHSPHNAMSSEHVRFLAEFIKNIASTHGLPLPGRLPNHEQKVLLLPSDMSKLEVYHKYKTACSQANFSPIGKSKFYSVWKEALPFIGTMKPATDLCFDCQQNITRISRSAHLPIEEKSQRLQAAEAHLTLARTERQNYNQQIEAAKDTYVPGQRPSVMHYSFDYAQQVHFPNNPQQPGPAYFLSARKCQIFGVTCEPTGKQVNYLLDEGETIGKGANATVSLLNHFLDNHGLKEDNMFLHADNCVGQNKNNVLIQYLLFRTLMGHHKSITLSFMLPGHTKFAPDRHFGLLKKTYRRTYVETMGCLERVVQKSSYIGANIPQRVKGPTGEDLVRYYDWKKFFEQYFKSLPGITSYHVFRTTHDHPGTIFVREHSQKPEIAVNLLKTQPRPSDFPSQMIPSKIDLARQWYLYEKIRPFCASTLGKDLTCPKPTQSKPASEPPQNTENPTGLPVKRSCSVCKQPGHTKRTCPKLQ